MILELFEFGVICLCEIMSTDSNTYRILLYDWDLPESTDNVNVKNLSNKDIITITKKFIEDLRNEIRPHKRLKIGDL